MSQSWDRLEFPLAQGWCKGLSIAFETTHSSSTLDLSQYIHVKQVHGAKIYEPSHSELQSGGLLNVEADGICLRNGQILESKFGLLIKTADCVPLIYVHRLEPMVCVVHAGWRGLQQKIHTLPFEKFGFQPRDTWVWLGPSLNGHCFEVSEDMWSQFVEKNDPEIFKSSVGNDPTKKHFYPWKKIENDFSGLGVELLYNVEVNTGENEGFSSWRRCQSQGLIKIPQQNYSWVKMILSP